MSNRLISSSLYKFSRNETDIDGLSFFPELEGHPMDADSSAGSSCNPSEDNSCLELKYVKDVSLRFKNTPINIMEIGVNRGNHSFTRILLDNKHPQSKYLGIDISDKSYLNDEKQNIFTFICDSMNQEDVRKKLNELSMTNLSILLIDGWHSVNTAFNDWKYADLLVRGGYVILHDVHYHPGPRLLTEAIDRKKYRVSIPTRYRGNQWGIALIKKL